MIRLRACAASAAWMLAVSLAAQQAGAPDDLPATLARIGDRVQQYYTRARTIVCTETVRVQPVTHNLTPDGFGRELVYELRVVWEPSSDGDRSVEASVVRQLLKVNGRPPRPKDRPGCLEPKPVSPEPLALLMSDRRDLYAFAWSGSGRIDGRQAVVLDYKAEHVGPPQVTWRDDGCGNVDLLDRIRGRIWVDAATNDVLRLDEHLTRAFEFRVPREYNRHNDSNSWIIERADSSIRYRAVTFHDPDETLMLPASIDSLTVIRNGGVSYRMTQVLSNYQRFVTGGRILREPIN